MGCSLSQRLAKTSLLRPKGVKVHGNGNGVQDHFPAHPLPQRASPRAQEGRVTVLVLCAQFFVTIISFS